MSIRSVIREIVEKEPSSSLVCEVLSIDKTERSCHVVPINADSEIFQVRLQSVLSGDMGFVIVPVVGSKVIVNLLNEETAFVSLCYEVDEIISVIEEQEFVLNQDGLRLKNNTSDLATEMNNLIEQLNALIDVLTSFQLSTNVGPTISVMPHIVTKLSERKTELKGIQTRFKTFLNAG